VWLKYSLDRLFSVNFCLFKAIVLRSVIGVHSGHPLTTLSDIYANVFAIYMSQRTALTQMKAWKTIVGVEECRKFFKLMLDNWAAKTPFTLKDVDVIEFKEVGDTGVKFLGMSIHAMKDAQTGKVQAFPVASKQKLVDALLFPRSDIGKTPGGIKERLIGITLSGAWFYPDLYKVCQKLFSGLSTANFTLESDFAGIKLSDVKEFIPTEALVSVRVVQMMFFAESKDNLRGIIAHLSSTGSSALSSTEEDYVSLESSSSVPSVSMDVKSSSSSSSSSDDGYFDLDAEIMNVSPFGAVVDSKKATKPNARTKAEDYAKKELHKVKLAKWKLDKAALRAHKLNSKEERGRFKAVTRRELIREVGANFEGDVDEAYIDEVESDPSLSALYDAMIDEVAETEQELEDSIERGLRHLEDEKDERHKRFEETEDDR